DDDTAFATQLFAPHLAFACEPRLAVQRTAPLEEDEEDDEGDRAGDQRAALQPEMKQRIAAIIPEPGGDGRDLYARADLVQADQRHQHRAQGACYKVRREDPRDDRDLSE